MKAPFSPDWLIVVGVLVLAFGCSGSVGCSNTPTEPSSPSAPHATTADLVFCVDDVNGFRARQRLSALTQTADLEVFAAAGAAEDHRANVAHQLFSQPHSVTVLGENELLNQALGGSVQNAMHTLNEASYAEGTFGGHYRNLMSSQFTAVGCGVFRVGNAVTITIDFR
jgi:uncharacterized protein YkwD